MMAVADQATWESYRADPGFQRYLEMCRSFDPEGFERALREDENTHSFGFRRVIMEAYQEDSGLVASSAANLDPRRDRGEHF